MKELKKLALFTDLNHLGNLMDFVLYLQDRNVLYLAPHIGKFGMNFKEVIEGMYKDWTEVIKEVIKEMEANNG